MRVVIAAAFVVVLVAVLSVLNTTWRGSLAVRRFRRAHVGSGRDLVIVHVPSDPVQRRRREVWLPRWGARAIELDAGMQHAWPADAPEVQLVRAVAARRVQQPIAIVVPEEGAITVVHFRRGFRDMRRGDDRALREGEARIARALGDPASDV